MSKQSFRYDFTMKEFGYFLFKKKACPNCGEKMYKEKCCEIIDGSVFNTSSVPLYIRRGQVKHYFYRYNCTSCGAKFTLTELSKEKKDET